MKYNKKRSLNEQIITYSQGYSSTADENGEYIDFNEIDINAVFYDPNYEIYPDVQVMQDIKDLISFILDKFEADTTIDVNNVHEVNEIVKNILNYILNCWIANKGGTGAMQVVKELIDTFIPTKFTGYGKALISKGYEYPTKQLAASRRDGTYKKLLRTIPGYIPLAY